MKGYIIVVLVCLYSTASFTQPEYKSPILSLELQASSNINAGNNGLSGSLNLLYPTTALAYETPNYWTASVTLSQLQVGDNSFFSPYNNLSILSILGGYRLAIGVPHFSQMPYNPPSQGFYIGTKIGIAFDGIKKVSPTIVLSVGEQISQRVELNISGQFLQGQDGQILILGIGGSFVF